MKVEHLEPEHLEELGYNVSLPGLFGYALRNGEDQLCTLAIYHHDNKWWASLDARGVTPRVAHRYALYIKDIVKSVGISEVWTTLETKKPKAEQWLRRLGFEPVGEFWRVQFGVDCRNSRGGSLS